METTIKDIMEQIINFPQPYGMGIETAILALFGLLAWHFLRFGQFMAIVCGVLAIWAIGMIGWEAAGPFVWLVIGAMATLPVVTHAPDAIRRRDSPVAAITLLALCAAIAVWDIPQGLMSGLAMVVFVSMALAAEGISPQWRYAIFLCLMTGLVMLAGADDMCLMLICFGHFAVMFGTFALAWAGMAWTWRKATEFAKAFN